MHSLLTQHLKFRHKYSYLTIKYYAIYTNSPNFITMQCEMDECFGRNRYRLEEYMISFAKESIILL